MTVVIVIVLLIAAAYLFMQQPQFGKNPAGDHLEKIKSSPHYKNGQFQNLNPTPQLTEGASVPSVLRAFFFEKSKRAIPSTILPSQKTNLLHLPPDQDVLVWFGHSSYFIQIDGRKFLVDPVLTGSASPLSFTTRSFKGSDVYTTNDIPSIDYLLVSHDHYDHLDHKTILQLKPKIKKVITGLGVGAHFQYWGYDRKKIIELDWNEKIVLEDGFEINTTPARHFSGRNLNRNKTLWLSFVLITPAHKIFIGGDSGYDSHFKEIGSRFGPFELAILENGQYNKSWKHIHMMPEEVIQAAKELKASQLLPVHWSKFSLSLHDWDEPVIRITKAAEGSGIRMLHPMIGEAVNLKGGFTGQTWWQGIT